MNQTQISILKFLNQEPWGMPLYELVRYYVPERMSRISLERRLKRLCQNNLIYEEVFQGIHFAKLTLKGQKYLNTKE